MSIHDEVNARCAEGRLHRLISTFPGARQVRTICASPDITAQLLGYGLDATDAARWGRVRADLESFLNGDMITVPKAGRRGRNHYMLRLSAPAPPEVWEIRCRDPRPSIRVFGRFADKDLFIALLWELRAPLGGPGDRPWRDASVQCATEWRGLFPSYDPLSGAYPHDYISDAIVL